MSLVDAYLARTARSRALFERATGSLPGGSTRTTVYTAPYPPYVAEGPRPGDPRRRRQRLPRLPRELHLADPRPCASGRRRGRRGAGPARFGVRGADRDGDRAGRGDPSPGPSIERLRFTSSGTEATMFAMRAARAFTGRPLVGRFDHAYHGTHDGVMTGTPGVPAVLDDLVVELPWGDSEGIEAGLRGREADLAAIIVEPVQGAGGIRVPEPDFLPFLRSAGGSSRSAADLRRDHLVPSRARWRTGALRGATRSDDAGQDHRRRVSAGGIRRTGRRDGAVRRPPSRRA